MRKPGCMKARGTARVPARLAVGVSAALILSLVQPARAEAPALLGPPRTSVGTPAAFERTLRTMEELGVPQPMLDRMRGLESVETATDVYAIGVRDLDGDRSADVIEWRTTYSLSVDVGDQSDPFAAGEEAETVFTARSGKDGKKLWRKKYDDFVIPVITTVGDGRRGVVTVGGLFSFFGWGERRLDLESLEGKTGKRLWARSFTSVEAGDYFNHVSTDAPVALGLGQTLPGKPVDVVVTLATEVSAPLASTTAARVVVVDGADGSVVTHAKVDVAVDWHPYADVVGDLEGDGLDDYVVVNDPGVDLGGPQEPPTLGGTIYARRGVDGSEIWTTSELDLNDFAWAYGIPHVAGGKAPEIAMLTPNDPYWNDFALYLFDGSTGAVRWKKLGFGLMVPGDIDRNGTPDLFMGDGWVSLKKHRGAFISRAFQGSGRMIYKKVHRWRFQEGLPCPGDLCGGGWGYGFGGAGDVHPDALGEHYFYLHARRDPNPPEEYLAIGDGRDGSEIMTLDGRTYPAGSSIDGRGDDLFRIKTKDGISTIEVLDGLTQRRRLRTVIQRTRGVLPRSTDVWVDTFGLPGDRCADLIVNMWSDEGSYYAILDGGSAKVLWSFWDGAKNARPWFTNRQDLNRAC